MKILFFGDIFGRPGREAIKKYAPKLVKKYNPDFTVANVENIAHGNGVTRKTLQEIDELGIFNAYTSGDHIWDTKIAEELLEDPHLPLIRPANYISRPGEGYIVVQSGEKRLLIINLLGKVFMKHDIDNPFSVVSSIVSEYSLGNNKKESVDAIIVDFHAEATSEKRAMGFHLNGKVSAVLGTHTHVPTLDNQILDKGTAYISDVGMVGPANSIIGLGVEPMVTQYISEESQKTDVSTETHYEVGAVLIETDPKGKAKDILHLRSLVDK